MEMNEMRDRSREFLGHLRVLFLATIVIGAALIVLLLFGVMASVVLLVTWFPAWLGTRLPAGKWLETIMNWIFDFDRMRMFRDEMLEIFRREVVIDEEMDRYWMLREMEFASERIDARLRNGKFVLAVIGGTLSILLAEYANIRIASIVLAIFIIGISLAILLRSVIIEVLMFDSDLYTESPHEEIAVRLGWNRGPINGRGAVLTALGTIVVGMDEWGYRLGKSILAEYVAFRYGGHEGNKWRDKRENPSED